MRREIFKIVLVIFLLIVYLLVGNHFNIYLFCPIKKFLGLYCPGCGVTRMLYSILKGQFYQAFRYNPLIFISLPFIVIYYMDYLYSNTKNKDTKLHFLEPGIWYFLIAIFIIYGILRNIEFFDFLRPTVI